MDPNPQQELVALERVLPALAHASRRQILMVVWIRGGAMNAGEISERFGCTWATTSRHLKVLEQAGLLIHERRGRERLYRVSHESLGVVARWLAWFDAAPNVTRPKSGPISRTREKR